MSDCQWATRFDLFVEKRYHRPGRAKNVAETNHGESSLVYPGDIASVAEQYRSQLTTQRLQRHLGKTFGTPHDVGWTHSLIGGNQYKVRNTRLQSCLGSIECTNDVIEHSFCNIVLDHRHVFIGSGVINSINAPGLHHIQQLMLITHRTQDR
ncbi:hypothetical protein D3C85_1341080 [compost metagenome]